jgi:hypothetical protein
MGSAGLYGVILIWVMREGNIRDCIGYEGRHEL